MNPLPRGVVARRSGIRRATLAVAAFCAWKQLELMIGANPDQPLDARLLTACGAALAVCLIAFAVRFKHLAFGLLACAFLWTADYLGNRPPGREHAHVLAAALLFTYVAAGALRGDSPAAEETCWDCCCAVIGAAYLLAGLSKLRCSGLGWINAHHLRVLTVNETEWSVGPLRAVRLALGRLPLLAWIASFYALAVELSGGAMLLKRWRPFYGAALLFLHLQIYVGMGILWWAQTAVIAALTLPFERWIANRGPAHA